MPPSTKHRRRRPASAALSGPRNNKKPRRADVEAAEIAELEARVAATKPARGSDAGIAPEKASAAGGSSNGNGGGNASSVSASSYPPMAGRKRFDELPLTRATLHGLALSGYVTMTAVQRAALPHALAGRDVLGAAKTGSGKTLAFVIPLLESLRKARWSPLDGLGGLILSPTRELGTQIFSTLGKVGRQGVEVSSAVLSAGLLVGGRDVREEALRVSGLTILVATPGRLLQHMDESPGFDASRLQVLVLDEADRLLDMGFAPTLDAILANLPRPRAAVQAELAKKMAKKGSSSSSSALALAPAPSSISSFGGHDGRQTLLFSATQTKRVADLARLSLRDPERVSVHEQAPAPTPPRLRQAFAVVALPDKADVLWAFIKSHLRCRVVVFFATCKQVRFFHEALRRLRPGTPLRALHGGMKQGARAAAFEQFVGDITGKRAGSSSSPPPSVKGKREKNSSPPASPASASGSGVLLATDVAARGLDFPAVDWVLQVDAPDDEATYVHRVGRTARYTAKGRALMLLAPSEKQGCVSKLTAAGVPLSEVKINPAKGAPVTPALAALLSKSPDLKQAAQRAVQSYARSIALQPDKATFDVRSMPVGEFAASLGLAVAPRMRFLAKAGRKAAAGEGEEDKEEEESESESGSGGDESESGSETEEEVGAAPPKAAAASSAGKKGTSDDDDDDDDDLLVVKRRDVFKDDDGEETENAPTTPGQLAFDSSKLSKKKKKKLRIPATGGAASVAAGERLVFDDEGMAAPPLSLLGEKLELSSSGSDDDDDRGDEREKEGEKKRRGKEKGKRDGLYVGEHATAETRLASAAAALRERDELDKEEYARGRRERRLEKKAKAKERARGEEEERYTARLGGGSSSEGEDGDDSSASPSSSSDEEEQERAPPRAVPDAGHVGMARRGEELAARMRQGRGEGKGGENSGSGGGGRSDDLAETEALALRLLAARRRGGVGEA